MKYKIILTLLIIGLIFTGCADVAQIQFTNPEEYIYGFWGGVWHGMIMFPAFFYSLFDNQATIYAVHNNGAWYNFGFVGGLGLMLKGIRIGLKLILLIFKK